MMNTIPRFRQSSNRGSRAGDEEAQQREEDQHPRRRVTGPRRTFNATGRFNRRGWSQSFSEFPLRRWVVLLVLACWAVAPVSFRLLASVAQSSAPAAPPKSILTWNGIPLGPDAIPSKIRVERNGGARRPLGGADDADPPGHVNPRDIVAGDDAVDLPGAPPACLNTVQGMTLLTDSMGMVCPRTRQDPLRPGCCSALHEPPTPTLRALSLPSPTRNAGKAFGKGGDQESDDKLINAGHDGRILEDSVWDAAGEASMVVPVGGVVSGAGFPPWEAFMTPFSCWSCDVSEMGGGSSCCRWYEFCVSCCLDPRRELEREMIHAAEARSGYPAYIDNGYTAANQQQQQGPPGGDAHHEEILAQQKRNRAFKHCAFRCRTNSGSVAHENSYRGPLKHCFGRYRPPTALGMSPNSDGSHRAKLLRSEAQTTINELQTLRGATSSAVELLSRPPPKLEPPPRLELDPILAKGGLGNDSMRPQERVPLPGFGPLDSVTVPPTV